MLVNNLYIEILCLTENAANSQLLDHTFVARFGIFDSCVEYETTYSPLNFNPEMIFFPYD